MTLSSSSIWFSAVAACVLSDSMSSLDAVACVLSVAISAVSEATCSLLVLSAAVSSSAIVLNSSNICESSW